MLRDTTEVTCTPEAIFQFFEDMESHYLQWHPDHKLFRWVTGRSLAVGNVFYFEEVIAGKLLKKNVIFTRIEAHSHIEFAPTFWLMRLFLPRLLFRIEAAAPKVCRFVVCLRKAIKNETRAMRAITVRRSAKLFPFFCGCGGRE